MNGQSRIATHSTTGVGRATTCLGALRLALAVAALAWAPAAAAQRCSGLTATPMVFTGFTPFGPGVAATSTISYTCDPGVTQAWIGIFDRKQLAFAGNVLSYDLYTTSDHSQPWPGAPPLAVPVGTAVTVTAYGFLPAQDAAAGSYTGTQRVVLYTGPGQARTDQVTMRVSVVVPPACTIGAGRLAFGAYDPLGANAAAPLDAQATLQIACTRNATWSVALGQGSFPAGAVRRMASGAQRLAYELYRDAGRTSVWSATNLVSGTAPSSAPMTLTVYGRIPAGQSAIAGAYADTVQSTIDF